MRSAVSRGSIFYTHSVSTPVLEILTERHPNPTVGITYYWAGVLYVYEIDSAGDDHWFELEFRGRDE